MRWLRRASVVFLGLAIAIAAGIVVLPILALFDPVTRAAGLALAEFAALVVVGPEPDGAYRIETDAFVSFAWTAIVATSVLPLVFAALIGEIARVRSLLWYAIATGFVAASMPWLIRGTFHTEKAATASPEELRFALVLFFAGVVSGSVYWLVAGGERAPVDPRAS